MQVYALYYILNNHFYFIFTLYSENICILKFVNNKNCLFVHLVNALHCSNWCVLRDMVVNELLIKIALLIEYQSV